MRMIDYLDRGAAHYPDRICLLDELARIDYRTAVSDSHRIGRGLLAAKLSPGAKAAVLSPNDARAFQAVLGNDRFVRPMLVSTPVASSVAVVAMATTTAPRPTAPASARAVWVTASRMLWATCSLSRCGSYRSTVSRARRPMPASNAWRS